MSSNENDEFMNQLETNERTAHSLNLAHCRRPTFLKLISGGASSGGSDQKTPFQSDQDASKDTTSEPVVKLPIAIVERTATTGGNTSISLLRVPTSKK